MQVLYQATRGLQIPDTGGMIHQCTDRCIMMLISAIYKLIQMPVKNDSWHIIFFPDLQKKKKHQKYQDGRQHEQTWSKQECIALYIFTCRYFFNLLLWNSFCIILVKLLTNSLNYAILYCLDLNPFILKLCLNSIFSWYFYKMYSDT